MKQKFLGLLILCCCISSLTARNINASATPDFVPITPENVNQLQQVVMFPIRELEEQQASDLAWSPDGSTLAVGIGYGIAFYDTAHLTAEPRMLETEDWVSEITFIPNSNFVAVNQHVYELTSFEEVETPTFYPGLVSPDETQMASIDPESQKIYLYDFNTREELGVFDVETDATCEYECVVYNLRFSPDGKVLAYMVGGRDYKIGFIDLMTNTITKSTSEYDLFSPTFSPNNLLFAVLGGQRGYEGSNGILLVEAKSGTQAGFISMFADNFSFNHDGTMIAVAGINEADNPPNLDEAWGTVYFFIVDQITRTEQITIRDALFQFPLAERIHKMALSPDGGLLAIVDGYNTVTVWGIPQ